MALSDCPDCWDTPCTCGGNYSHMTIDQLKERRNMFQTLVEERLTQPILVVSEPNLRHTTSEVVNQIMADLLDRNGVFDGIDPPTLDAVKFCLREIVWEELTKLLGSANYSKRFETTDLQKFLDENPH